MRALHRGWRVLFVLGAVGALLIVLGPAETGAGDRGAPRSSTGLGGSAAADASLPSPVTTTTTVPPATSSTATSTSSTTTSTTSTTLPLFTGQRPLRVLAVGDSLMTFPGYALVDQMEIYAGLIVESVTKQSSGLVRPDYYDWPEVLGSTVRELRPHVVVVLLGANDMQPVLRAGRPAALFTENWDAEYAKRIDQFIQIVTGSGASVIWVGLPIMRDPKFSKVEHRLNEFYAAGCAARPGAVYIDGYALFAGEDGAYASKLPDASGEVRLMRAKDGIHFTMDGARRIADEVVEVLLRSCRLELRPAEAVPSADPE